MMEAAAAIASITWGDGGRVVLPYPDGWHPLIYITPRVPDIGNFHSGVDNSSTSKSG